MKKDGEGETYAHSAIFSSPACCSKFEERDSRMSEETRRATRLKKKKEEKRGKKEWGRDRRKM